VTVLYKLPLAVPVWRTPASGRSSSACRPLAILTGAQGRPRSPRVFGPAGDRRGSHRSRLRQLLLGALVATMGAGLAISDFPLAFGGSCLRSRVHTSVVTMGAHGAKKPMHAQIRILVRFQLGYAYFAAHESTSWQRAMSRTVVWRPFMLGAAFRSPAPWGCSRTP